MRSKAIKYTVLITVLLIVFLALFGKILFAFFFLPLYSDIWIVIPEGECVCWNDLRERPTYIDENAYWFSNCLVGWQIGQLERYMKRNNVCIASGTYFFDTSRHGDELIDTFRYVDIENEP